MTWEPKIHQLPGARLTPDTVLHRTLTKLEHIESVAVVIMWKDGTFSTDWSQMKLSELCMAERILDLDVDKALEDAK